MIFDAVVKYQVATTEELIAIDKTSRNLNQGMAEQLIERLDPEGLHLCSMRFVHNDHYRTLWLVKEKDNDDPVGPVMIDVPNLNKIDALPVWSEKEGLPV
jgi:hypothetical protein